MFFGGDPYLKTGFGGSGGAAFFATDLSFREIFDAFDAFDVFDALLCLALRVLFVESVFPDAVESQVVAETLDMTLPFCPTAELKWWSACRTIVPSRRRSRRRRFLRGALHHARYLPYLVGRGVAGHDPERSPPGRGHITKI